MNKEEQRTESLEEIVFRHRNKAYGAYQLRNDYRKFVTIAMIFALFITSGVVSYPLVTAMYKKPVNSIGEEIEINVVMNEPPAEEKPREEAPKPPEPEMEKVRFVAPVVVDSAGDDEFGKQDLLADQKNTEVTEEITMTPKTEEKQVVIEQPPEKEIWTIVEIKPEFPGGEEALMNYLAGHLKYPESAKELGIQGIVFINFVIEKDGSITDVKVMRGIGGGCDEIALQAVREMPNWIPGRQQGILVRVSFNLPVRFTLH